MELSAEAVEEKVLALLENLMQDEELQEFFLVGGTALALRLKHRKSVDIDLFTRGEVQFHDLQKYLADRYGFQTRRTQKDTLIGEIDGIKADFIRYDYPLLKPLEKIRESIRTASTEDIIAMKLVAITDSGTRMKDFVDIAFLSTLFTLHQMLEFYTAKFKGVNPISPVRALVYHEDIPSADTVQLVQGRFSWPRIQKRLFAMVNQPHRRFAEPPIV